jgi:hypothetical protein
VASTVSVSGVQEFYFYREEATNISEDMCEFEFRSRLWNAEHNARAWALSLERVEKEFTSSESFHWMLCHDMLASMELSSH